MEKSLSEFCEKYGFSYPEYMPPKAFGDIYHYTQYETAGKILFGGLSGTITFRATRSDCFKDETEGQLVHPRYLEACDKLKATGVLDDEAYSFFAQIQPDETELFLCMTDDGEEAERLPGKWYAISFTPSGNSDYMWKHYGAANLQLHIDAIPIPHETNYDFYPVLYDKNKQIDLICNFLKDINVFYSDKDKHTIKSLVQCQMTAWKMLFKKADYKAENEVRLIASIPRNSKGIEMKNGEKYYIEVQIPREYCSRITVNLDAPGEKPQPEEIIKQIGAQSSKWYESADLCLKTLPDNELLYFDYGDIK